MLPEFCEQIIKHPVLKQLNVGSVRSVYDKTNHSALRIHMIRQSSTRKITIMLFTKFPVIISGWISGNELYAAYVILVELVNRYYTDLICEKDHECIDDDTFEDEYEQELNNKFDDLYKDIDNMDFDEDLMNEIDIDFLNAII
jgi:hypothetical protein